MFALRIRVTNLLLLILLKYATLEIRKGRNPFHYLNRHIKSSTAIEQMSR